LALLLFVHFLNGKLKRKIQDSKEKAQKWALETWEVLKNFLNKKSKTYNDYSFTEFLRTQIPKSLFFYLRVKKPNSQFKTAQQELFT
jgi:hypothetical protein